ncbi:adenosyl cobinamide kinase/adenosyl cobinamide phosphate guanylyltransferase [Motilibacter peucedani]|uniref:Adenosylcobinamide kinase n=1 Tax=Motilibacter peucedani TaxID=598650 RepID=A0A420XP98_9ACTN|nr:bifunctional adenosylcobinamide kinase/adenosylcobinamide-phosphate guanylyltransferase [Motilibacter peucedani]RKS74023.1 adenosyl cobinamide kinase/adenosyl cobinamide phosphate guanylyltransferase [Motilibacter peucedani]
MDLRLAGTGGPLGWPEPGCPCAACATAARSTPRAPLRLLLDGRELPPVSGPVGDGSVLLALDEDATAAPGTYAVVLLADADLALLAALRRSGAVTPSTDVVAVGLTHRHGPAPLPLDDLGIRVLPDGAAVVATPSPAPPRRTLVLGGTRSGKSAEAERRLLGEPEVVYVATAPPRTDDGEWAARVAAHRLRRPVGWTTVETVELEPLLAADGPPLLVDDLGLLVTTLLAEAGAWDGGDLRAVHERVDALVAAWQATRRRVVAVSPEVGAGVVPAERSGRLFRDELGSLAARLAAESERVVQVVAGRVTVL